MNKLFILCALLFIAGFTSCTKDKNARDWQCETYMQEKNGYSITTFILKNLTEKEMKEMISADVYQKDKTGFWDTMYTTCK